MKISKVRARIATSADGLQELKHVEEQIIGMSVLPDFGYAEDNYILERGSFANKWELLTELLNDSDKYAWLINQIKLRALRKDAKHAEHLLELAKQRRETHKQKKLQANDNRKEKNPLEVVGRSELNELLKMQEASTNSLSMFKSLGGKTAGIKRALAKTLVQAKAVNALKPHQ